MPEEQLSCMADADGTLVITRRKGIDGVSSPHVVARVYDHEYALLMARSPDLLAAIKWLRSLLAKGVCQCQPGVNGCVACVTDDLVAEIEKGVAPGPVR
jgi:hypothetical protein